MNIKLMLAFSILTIKASEFSHGLDYQKTIKFLYDYKRTQVLIKVGLETASSREIQAALEIVSKEYDRSNRAIGRAEAKIFDLVRLFVAKEYDLEALFNSVIAINKQLGQLLDDQLAFLRPVAGVDAFRHFYSSISRRRERLKPLESDPSSLVVLFFKRIAKKELCLYDLKNKFKDLFLKLKQTGVASPHFYELAHLTVLISMMDNPGKAVIELAGKDSQAIFDVASEIYRLMVEVPAVVAESRKFLCKEKDWKTIENLACRTRDVVESFVDNLKAQGQSMDDYWIVFLHFFAKGLSILHKETRTLIEKEDLLKALLTSFINVDLRCFSIISTATLCHKDYVLRRFTPKFRIFFNLMVAIGIESERDGMLCESSLLLTDDNPLVKKAESLRSQAEAAMREIVIEEDLGGSESNLSLGSSIPTLPRISIRPRNVTFEDLTRNFKGYKDSSVDHNVQQEVLNCLFQIKRLYSKLKIQAKAAILDYFTGHKNIDFLRYKVRVFAHTYLHNTRTLFGRYSAIKSSGCLRQEFDAINSLVSKIQMASENTCEFLTEVFRAEIIEGLDFYAHKENLIHAYQEYKKGYGEVCVQRLLSLQQDVFSSVLYVRAIINPELVFSESHSKQKESYLKMAGQFCSGMYGY